MVKAHISPAYGRAIGSKHVMGKNNKLLIIGIDIVIFWDIAQCSL
jgi:hypothetical protein